MMRSLLAAGAALVWSSAVAWAQEDTRTGTLTIGECPAPQAAEEADQAVVHQAILDFNRGGYALLRRSLPALESALRRAPACYPMIERREGAIHVRTLDENEYFLISRVIGGAPGSREEIIMSGNTYGNAALLLGSFAVEMRDYNAAISWLDMGLALQPDNQLLIGEKGVALSAMNNFQEEFDLYEAALNNPALGFTLDRGGFMRRRGIALIDLNRLDEAESSLNEALRLNPDDQLSRDELAYITHLRRGGARTPYTVLPNTPPSKPPI